MEKVKINLGCGADYREGWINVDDLSMADCKVDIKANILEYDREPDGVDEILLSHVAMYIRPEEMKTLLKRWNKWLKKDGKLTIETIDLEKVMECALNPFEDRTNLGLINIFGREDTGPHRWGWIKDFLLELVARQGFREVAISTDGVKKQFRDYKIIAIK